jgi:hypothetical protein
MEAGVLAGGAGNFEPLRHVRNPQFLGAARTACDHQGRLVADFRLAIRRMRHVFSNRLM